MSYTGDKPFESSAQNFEDVVLWRALQDVERGCYVEVGACDPVVDSVSWSFYKQGWRGALIEPVPSLAAALRRRRANDTIIEAAASAKAGTATLFVSEPAGNSTLVRDVSERVAAAGSKFSECIVRTAPLDDLLDDVGFEAQTIHFCAIDVEGSEANVLAGFNLARWRPWILVIEATEPNQPRASHEPWEEYVLGAGYRSCLFDGINRFYVHLDKADDFAEQLSYPACVFDAPFNRAMSAARWSRRRVGELEEIAVRVPLLERENAALLGRATSAEAQIANAEAQIANAEDQIEAMKTSISWRVTRPLRIARDMQRSLVRGQGGTGRQPLADSDQAAVVGPDPELADGSQAVVDRDVVPAFTRRIAQAAETLCPEMEFGSQPDFPDALDAFEEALTCSAAPHGAKAWLSRVAVDGCYPNERSVERMARLLRIDGAKGVRTEMLRCFAQDLEQGRATAGGLDVRRDGIMVDVTHTAVATDLHTGIQRVVRETVARWIDTDRPMNLIRFELPRPAARVLSDDECERFKSWRNYVGSKTRTAQDRVPESAAANTVVPWQCRLLVPELPFETERTSAYRALATASVLRSLSMVGYDVIPMVAAEKVTPEMTTTFGGYLSVVKHADRVSTISRTSRDSFKAFATMAAAEGLNAPKIAAHDLPSEAHPLDPVEIDAARSKLGVQDGVVVLVVGSHEPRKNHLAVLEAAERLWAGGERTFELLFLGWSSWLSEEFDELVTKLTSAGRRIIVHKHCSEEELWAAYRLARFTIFPSLLEGFGLPIAESLACGTPVITSNYGSMAEVAEDGGCLLVDPRNIDELERAMAQLLDDDDALRKLRDQAVRVDTGTWESYADTLWDFFTKTAVEEHPTRGVEID